MNELMNGYFLYQAKNQGFGIVKAETEEEAKRLVNTYYTKHSDPISELKIIIHKLDETFFNDSNVLELGWDWNGTGRIY